ncbi:MAG: OmpH family outer membrane protein [Desulfovibrionaceae bacterium]|nr:OmpH family outer membrane protein [Desulfovibrionaceae bacterium]
MKRFIAVCILLLSFPVIVGCNKVAVVDPSRLFQESNSGRAAIAYLQRLEKEVKKKSEQARQTLERASNYEAAGELFQKQFQEYQAVIEQEQQKISASMNEQARHAIEVCRKRYGYTIIVSADSAVAYDKRADITHLIIEEMNRYPLPDTPADLPLLFNEKAAPQRQK